MAPRFQRSKQFKVIRYTGGNITLNSPTAMTALLSTTLDITLLASVGDVIAVTMAGVMTSSSSIYALLDVASIASGGGFSNFWGSNGVGAGNGATPWYKTAALLTTPFSATVARPLVAADIVAGSVTIRPVQDAAASSTLYAVATIPFHIMVENKGPQGS